MIDSALACKLIHLIKGLGKCSHKREWMSHYHTIFERAFVEESKRFTLGMQNQQNKADYVDGLVV